MSSTENRTSPFEIAARLAAVAAEHNLPTPRSVTTSVGGSCPLYAQMHFTDHDQAAAWLTVITSSWPHRVREPEPERGEWVTFGSGAIGDIRVSVHCATDMTAEEIAAATAEAVLAS